MPTPDDRAALVTDGPLSPRIANYRIEAELDVETRRIEATQTLRWTNTGDSAVEELPFHLYMNAFKNDESVFMRESHGQHRGQQASDDGWGWIEVPSIRIGGVELREDAGFDGPDQTVLTVRLPEPVEAGATIDVDMDFTVQLPEVFARTGYKGEFIMVGQWFPKIGVLVGPAGAERWYAEPFHLNSEFFADFGTYDVSLTVPDTHVVAATGVLTDAVDDEGPTRTLTYRAEDVHDFAWMVDPYMEYVSATATNQHGEVEVRVYYRPEQRHFAERHLEAGVGAIEQYSRLYYPYPWSQMSIITPPPDAAGGAGGMEYPTLVTTSGDVVFARPGVRLPEFVTVHEVGHNWFQGLLASNEVESAWLDEGVNTYSNGVVLTELYGEDVVEWTRYSAGFFELQQTMRGRVGHVPDPIATPSYEFADTSAYGAASYAKTALAMHTLANIVGQSDFRDAMRAYAHRYAFRHPTGEDLFATLEQELGRDLDWFVEPAFYQRGEIDFHVRDVDCRHPHAPRGVFGRGEERSLVPRDDAEDEDGWICDVMVVNRGNVLVPVDVELRFADGDSLVEHWPGKTAWHEFRVERSSRVTEVVIDPEQNIVLNDELLDSAVRTEGDSGAARRAGARVQFWTQTLMQLTGL